jgi:hypothetical protein
MAETIESNKVLPPSNIGDVRPETRWDKVERLLPLFTKNLAATGILIAAVWILVTILFSESAKLQEYRSGAWGLLSAMVGGAMAHFFGESWKPNGSS